MENIIDSDSPLAAYLLEGEGKAGSEASTEQPSPASARSSRLTSPVALASFAPTTHRVSSLRRRIKDKLPKPLKVRIPRDGPVARIHSACSRAINSQLSSADNNKFLEHFRYTIVASQLLTEHHGYAGTKPMPQLDGASPLDEYRVVTTSVTGAVVTASTAFALVWLIHWSRAGRANGFSKSRLAVVITAIVLVGTVIYAYAKRQWLQYLRQHAVNAAQTMVTNLQAYNSSSAASLTLIQEVELVSRGYRLHNPLPPITRMEESGQTRRCARLRKCLHRAYAATIPPFQEAYSQIRSITLEDDLEKYFDVYDIGNPDIQEADLGYSDNEFEDMESLKTLRILQLRLSILRRVFLCALLSLQAEGRKVDFLRWKSAIDAMERLAAVTGEHAEKINAILTEEESFSFPTTPSKRLSYNPERDRLRTQVRKIGSLSSGIRGLQAKLQILREETTRSLEESDDISEAGASLLAQYDSIGADLKSLMHAWESGRTNLVLNIERNERRISQASSGLRSPTMSLGGTTAVDETFGGSPTDALRALNGELPLHMHPSDSSGPHSVGSASDEEIFEAIAIPRTRPRLTREQQLAKMHEDRIRIAAARERREAGMSMIRELQSVINARPGGGKNDMGRITSI